MISDMAWEGGGVSAVYCGLVIWSGLILQHVRPVWWHTVCSHSWQSLAQCPVLPHVRHLSFLLSLCVSVCSLWSPSLCCPLSHCEEGRGSPFCLKHTTFLQGFKCLTCENVFACQIKSWILILNSQTFWKHLINSYWLFWSLETRSDNTNISCFSKTVIYDNLTCLQPSVSGCFCSLVIFNSTYRH